MDKNTLNQLLKLRPGLTWLHFSKVENKYFVSAEKIRKKIFMDILDEYYDEKSKEEKSK